MRSGGSRSVLVTFDCLPNAVTGRFAWRKIKPCGQPIWEVGARARTIKAEKGNKMKRTNLLFGAMLALFALIASKGWAADKPVIGLVMKSLANPFYKTLVDGAQAYEAERGDFVLKAVGM